MEVVVTIAVAVLVVAALAAVGAKAARGPATRPGPSGDRHPDPGITDRPAGADAEDADLDPQRLGSQEGQTDDTATPSEAAGKSGEGEDERPTS